MIHSAAMLTNDEAQFLYDFARKFRRPLTWVELGSWCGRSYWSAGCGLPEGSTMIGVDEFSGMLPVEEGSDKLIQWAPPSMQMRLFSSVMQSLKELSPGVKFDVRMATTHEASEYYEYLQQVDVLLVDAAHDYESVRQDLADWLPKMRRGGTVIAHDYTVKYPGVVRAVDEAAKKLVRKVPKTRYACWSV
jgi:hypothetical protein